MSQSIFYNRGKSKLVSFRPFPDIHYGVDNSNVWNFCNIEKEKRTSKSVVKVTIFDKSS